MKKHCCRCGRDLPRGMFYKNRAKSDGLQQDCKDCVREVAREWRKKHSLKIEKVYKEPTMFVRASVPMLHFESLKLVAMANNAKVPDLVRLAVKEFVEKIEKLQAEGSVHL